MSAELDEINRVARVLIGAWEAAERKPVGVSYVATFADMARAIVADQAERVRVAEDLAESRYDAMVAWRENAEEKAARAAVAEAAVVRVKALVARAEMSQDGVTTWVPADLIDAALARPAGEEASDD